MAVKPITARRRIELSQLNPKTIQREVMGDDSGWEKFAITLASITAIPDISDRITGATINRSIDGASTLDLEINDFDRKFMRSNLLKEGLDVEIDGLWFRLTAVDKNDDSLNITFQDREIEILRTYNKWKIAKRGDMTRAEFVLSMIREVKELTIPVVIPELHKVQPIAVNSDDIVGADTVTFKNGGIPKDTNNQVAAADHHHRESQSKHKANPQILTVKSGIADETQIQNANIILAVGDQMGVSRRLKIVAMMVAITETLIRNDPGGPNAHNTTNDQAGDDSAGVFQQRPSWGSYTERTDVETASRLFYKAAIAVESQHPDDPFWVIAAAIQRPKLELQTRYSLYRVEAERFVNAYGDVGIPVTAANGMAANQNTFGSTDSYYYYRGSIEDKRGKPFRKPENTWKCTQRLADDVDWRSFFVSGTYYFISEIDLLKQLPLAIINEFTPGIQKLNGSYNKHAKNGTIELEAIVGSWTVPPGGVVLVKDVGHPFDGRWIVSSYQRDLIGSNKVASISLKKPRPVLPEPHDDPNASTLAGWVPVSANIPPVKDVQAAVLSSKNIILTRSSQTNDIRFGEIYEPVLRFMLWMADQGYTIRISALKSDHSKLTSHGNPSAHSAGKAVDIDQISGEAIGENEMTGRIMDLIGLYQLQLQFSQLIGPWPLKCLGGPYDSLDISQHKNHLHVGWPL